MKRISKIKKGYNNPNLIFYDIETKVDNGKMVFRLGVVTYDNISFTFYDVDLMTQFIIEITEKRKNNFVIAHNAQFDFALLNHDYFNDFELKLFTSNPFIIKYAHNDGNRHLTTITFIDSMAFFKNSLSELGAIFGKEKIVVDVLRNNYDSEIAEYCKQDTLIVQDIMMFIDSQVRKYDIEFPYTFAQMAFLIYKKHFLNLSISCPDMKDIMLLERESYFGGRVEAFDFNQYNAKVYDINSLYPYVMSKNYFPISVIGYYNRENCYQNQSSVFAMVQNHLDNNDLIIARVIIQIEDCFISPVPKRYDGKIIFPCGTFETTLCTPELKLVQENIIEIKEVSIYTREKIFSNYVDTFYSERNKYPKKHPNNLFYKLLMNSLYGKFGQRRFEFKRFEEYDGLLRYGYTDLDTGTEELTRIEFFNHKAFRKDIFYDNPSVFVAIASFVTSYARVELYQSLINNLDSVIYCDTDSMILKQDPEQITIGKELGNWKLEKNYENFEVLGNKHYRAKGVLKVKGVPSDAEILGDYSFRFEKITKMKESIVRYKDPTPHVIIMTKNYNDDYDKRIVLEDKTTKPLTLSESPIEQVSLT